MQGETLPVLLHAAKLGAAAGRPKAHIGRRPLRRGGGWRRDAHYLLAQSSYPMMKKISYSFVDWLMNKVTVKLLLEHVSVKRFPVK